MESIPIVVGLLFFTIGGYILFDTYKFRKISRKVAGRLLGYEPHTSSSKNGTMYTPVVEFVCNGDTYCFKASISSNLMPYKMGKPVPVLYLENDPHNARIRTNIRYMLGVIIALFGAGALTIGVVNFSTNGYSLIVSFGVLGYMAYKALKFKAKLNAKGVHTLDDIKEAVKNPGFIESDLTMSDIQSHSDKNYQPSENLIATQADIKELKKIPKWVATLIIVVGIGLLSGGAYWTQKRADFLAVAESAQGRIVSMESSTSDGSTVYYPIVGYTFPYGNQSAKFKHSVGSSHPGWQVGDTVTVLYNPADQNDAMIDDDWLNWLGPGILSVMGAIFFFGGVSIKRRQH